ncbi:MULTISPECIES: serine protease [unclassified Mesorhizobium]|uniref:SDH family Clp fold serine proteinase n=1 Tax=unclassified Mesorhizobium TaxID=325217 RepID=UPI000FCB8926|nr:MULTISPECIES: serine protease [unclassified Mesorhizobium]RUW22150.1 serine protease [Mesorhizobium sp. M4B.F.Ca.ET.013.02.1.1]RVD21145.1 serine protease [Mesorhizobium sp. M4B.F.Ca.ET.017.02.2.1]
MAFAARRTIYRKIEAERKTKVIAYATSDRSGAETQIGQDCVDLFVDILDKIGPTPKISLLLHTNGGSTSAAWRLINLIKSFCDELEVLIPLKAMSAGTLISLGASKIVMTKQAALGPIDPSLTHALGPQIPVGNQLARVPVSVEAVRGYLDAATKDLGVKSDEVLGGILTDLSNKVHPLVLGEIFRSRAQIRFLASKLLKEHVQDPDKVQAIIDFLCADSGSHDYTINRREAAALGLPIEKPSDEFYDILKKIHKNFSAEMRLADPFNPSLELGANATANYRLVRGIVESVNGGCYGFLSEGTLTKTQVPNPAAPLMQLEQISDQRNFEGWKKI